jgi:uncharacterized damage-inducible protein DinB
MGAFTYPRSEPGSSGHLDLVEKLNATTHTLHDELTALPDSVLTYRPKEKEWSLKETAGHLCDVGRVLHKRLFMMIKLEEPRLPDYDPQEMASHRDAQSARIGDLLAEFAAQRAETVDMLADLVHWNWARTGRHPTLGRISIRQQVDLWLEHEAEHLTQIRDMKAAATSGRESETPAKAP